MLRALKISHTGIRTSSVRFVVLGWAILIITGAAVAIIVEMTGISIINILEEIIFFFQENKKFSTIAIILIVIAFLSDRILP